MSERLRIRPDMIARVAAELDKVAAAHITSPNDEPGTDQGDRLLEVLVALRLVGLRRVGVFHPDQAAELHAIAAEQAAITTVDELLAKVCKSKGCGHARSDHGTDGVCHAIPVEPGSPLACPCDMFAAYSTREIAPFSRSRH